MISSLQLSALQLDVIHLGKCEELLASLPDHCVDAIITDPPYGMGTKIPRWEDVQRYINGGRLNTGGDFMGKGWELPTGTAIRHMLRVLRPGGYCVAFSSTRTHDVVAAAFMSAGFMFHPSWKWVYGQGMPKSTNISKQIDKLKGLKRKVIGVKPGHEGFVGRGTSSVDSFKNSTMGQEGGFARPWMDDPEKVEQYHLLTEAASEEAKQWEGWGTALKPSWEPILVFSNGEPTTPLGTRFLYSPKTNVSEATLGGEIENDHPTKKPLSLMRQLVQLLAPRGGIILDPYVGSGTTAEAAVREGRRFIAMEMGEPYFKIATKRLSIIDDTVGSNERCRDNLDFFLGLGD